MQDIDDAIHNEPMIPIPKHVDPEISANQCVSCCNLVDIAAMDADRVWENHTQVLNGKIFFFLRSEYSLISKTGNLPIQKI